jgi:hypothetical protein
VYYARLNRGLVEVGAVVVAGVADAVVLVAAAVAVVVVAVAVAPTVARMAARLVAQNRDRKQSGGPDRARPRTPR